MDGPGISLFQGSDSIRLNNSNQREEEEEFIAEERQRKAELNNLFQNAFDDLIDEDDDDDASTVNSSQCSSRTHGHQYTASFDSESDKSSASLSQEHRRVHQIHHINEEINSNNTNFTNHHLRNHVQPENGDIYNGPATSDSRYKRSPSPEDSRIAAYTRTELNGIEQLKVLYDVRMREIERLKKELEAERASKEQILRKLNICETEKSGILSSNKQLNGTLALSNDKIRELEEEISIIKEEIKKVGNERDKCKDEAEILKMETLNLKQQMTVMQRCEDLVERKHNYESIIESLKIKHEKEITSLNQQYELALQKINEKEEAQHQLEQKIEEMERRHMATLLNKCDATVRQEATVKALLDQANMEKLELTKKMNALQAEVNMLRNDLEQYESVSRLRLFNTSSSDELETDSIIQMGITKKTDTKKSNSDISGPQIKHNYYTEDMITKLKDELHRAIIGQRSKRSEIKKLQEQIQHKELQINRVKEREKSYMKEIDSLKKELANINELLKNSIENTMEHKHTEKIISLEKELEKLKAEKENNLHLINSLENEIKSLQEQLKKEEFNKKRIAEEYVEFHDNEVLKLHQQYQATMKEKELEWSKKMDEILNENDEIKQLYIEIRESKDTIIKKLEEESLKTNTYAKERDDMKLLSDKLKEDILRLENHVLDLNRDKRELEDKLTTLRKEFRNISTENEKDKASTEIIVTSNGNQINLEKMREEVAQAKQKYVDLEKSLKLEYEEQVLKLQADNCNLRETLKKKEEKLSDLTKVNTLERLTKVEAATITEDTVLSDVGVINEKQIEEINKLRKEIERLKALELKKSQEILQLEFEFQKTLQNELEELETKLISKHKEELTATEGRIKNFSMQYYSSEMNKLQERHKMEMQNIMKQHAFQIEEIKKILAKKEAEIHHAIELKEQLVSLKEILETERKDNTEKLINLTQQLEELKRKLEGNILEINELNAKLISTRKKAIKYRNALKKVKTIILANYDAIMADIKDRSEAIALKESLVEMNLKAIEEEYGLLRKEME